MNLKEQFITRLAPFFNTHGFTFNKKQSAFAYTDGLNTFQVTLDFSKYGQRFTADVMLLIRSAEIAAVKADYQGDAFKGPFYFTVRMSHFVLAALVKDDTIRPHYILDSSEDVARATDTLTAFIPRAGLPFFSKFKTIEDYDAWFNQPVLGQTCDFKGDPEGDAIEGLIAAKLSRNPNFDELYRLWVDGIKATNKYDDACFQNLATLKHFLDTRSL